MLGNEKIAHFTSSRENLRHAMVFSENLKTKKGSPFTGLLFSAYIPGKLNY